MALMVDQITERFRVNALEALSQDDIQKFSGSDSSFQDANFAKEFNRLANKVRQSVLSQFNNDRIDKVVETVLGKANRRNRRVLYNTLKRRLSVDPGELAKTEGLTFQANARIAESAEWVKKLRDETLEGFHLNSLHAMAEGRSIDYVVEEFRNTANKRRNHVQYLARTQINNFNSQMTRLRAKNLGITKAKWLTANDERVRGRPGGRWPNAKPSHWDLHNTEFDLEEGAAVNGRRLWPGSDHNCRCTYMLVIPGEEQEG